jgi:hypothetical protein
MTEPDPLRPVLREWEAPEPSAAMDARMLAAFRGVRQPTVWQRLWNWRVSMPVPVLAALVILVAAFLIEFRSAPEPAPVAGSRGYTTRLDDTGFQPLPDGAASVVPVKGIQQ